MPGFDASSVVEPLEYNLNPFVDASGVVKEPSDDQVAAAIRGVKEVGKKIIAESGLEDMETDDPMAVLQALDNLDPNLFVTAMKDMAQVFSALCSGRPSVTQLMKVPFRIRLAFFQWLMSEVTNPEASTGAGSGAAQTPALAVAGPSSMSSGATSTTRQKTGTG